MQDAYANPLLQQSHKQGHIDDCALCAEDIAGVRATVPPCELQTSKQKLYEVGEGAVSAQPENLVLRCHCGCEAHHPILNI